MPRLPASGVLRQQSYSPVRPTRTFPRLLRRSPFDRDNKALVTTGTGDTPIDKIDGHMITSLEAAIGPIKTRDRGFTGAPLGPADAARPDRRNPALTKEE